MEILTHKQPWIRIKKLYSERSVDPYIFLLLCSAKINIIICDFREFIKCLSPSKHINICCASEFNVNFSTNDLLCVKNLVFLFRCFFQ